MVFNREGNPVASAYREHRQIFPQPGWVEHDPIEIWQNTLAVIQDALAGAHLALSDLAGVGMTNQRETTVVWDAASGDPLYNAIVWQDRRTSDRCAGIREEGRAEWVREKTGLPPDPYFSATKLEWLLENIPGLRKRAERGEALFGTIDSWLIWNLTGIHATDATNASRTLLFNLGTLDWDEELLACFGVPHAMLPRVLPSSGLFGMIDKGRCPELFEGMEQEAVAVPIAGDLGDQQAALFGQAGTLPGEGKCTYGTGSFLLMNTGCVPMASKHGLLSTVAYGLSAKEASYALEGSVFISGAAVQWLRDGLGLIKQASEIEALAGTVEDNGGVYIVPAFAGLGAPYWNPYARGTIVGISRGVTSGHFARATLEAIAYQTRDVLEAMAADFPSAPLGGPGHSLKVDGGAVKNNLLCQIQSDLLGIPVVRPVVEETTALGAAYAAGLAVGFWQGTEELRSLWKADRTFEPAITRDQRDHLYSGWKRAVRAALVWTE
jgi:glycerol kinase